jgi:hypothetical protein
VIPYTAEAFENLAIEAHAIDNERIMIAAKEWIIPV